MILFEKKSGKFFFLKFVLMITLKLYTAHLTLRIGYDLNDFM